MGFGKCANSQYRFGFPSDGNLNYFFVNPNLRWRKLPSTTFAKREGAGGTPAAGHLLRSTSTVWNPYFWQLLGVELVPSLVAPFPYSASTFAGVGGTESSGNAQIRRSVLNFRFGTFARRSPICAGNRTQCRIYIASTPAVNPANFV